MNAGCYGCQTADNLKEFIVIKSRKILTYLKRFKFKYRSSCIDEIQLFYKQILILNHSDRNNRKK